MALTGLTVFLGAFLLFLVQPIIAKLMLPRFGGSVAVWATCLVFFQAALLLGYALAHHLVGHPRRRWLQAAHLALLAGSLALLPIVPLPAWQAATGPALQILLLLVLTIGLPFTLLSMTSPLLQAWIAESPSRANPYRLFAVSNLASLVALLAYPWLIEPWLRTATQARVWSAAYAAYVVLLALLSLQRPHPPSLKSAVPATIAHAADAGAPGWPITLSWFGLAALGSYVLVAVTNHLTQNIPSFPMMWVLPLVIYLASFTLSFDGDRWYPPRAFRAAMGVALLLWAALLVWERPLSNLALQIGGFLAGLFVVCMVCHGELARSRPAPAQLTRFYLAVSAGGVVGGALVALAAPALLPGYFELEIGLVLLAVMLLWRSWRGPAPWVAAAAAVTLLAIATAAWRIHDTLTSVVDLERNFYGVVRIREYPTDQPGQVERVLIHGRVMHGQQFMAPQRRRQPTSYYTEASGIGRLLTALDDRPIDVGAIGLGAGTIATYGKPGDRYRFYEIDDAIVAAAHRYFSFIADSPAAVDVQVGDGRLLLQQEGERRFDVIVVDAFSGDSIPVHLLTREAVALYRDRLKPGGVVALHVSNTHLELAPVVAGIAAELGLQASFIADPGVAGDVSKSASDWVLLAADRSILDLPAIAEAAAALPAARGRTWTDDYSNIVQVLSFGRVQGPN